MKKRHRDGGTRVLGNGSLVGGKVSKPKSFLHHDLRVVHQAADSPLTAIALAVRAGARFDDECPGIAHVAEHMLFQGTAQMDQEELNHRAADLGGEHNADTGYETICITLEVFNEDLDDALALLAEQFYRTSISEERLAKERRVVIDEIRGRIDDPIDRLHTRAWAKFFGGAISDPIWGSIKSLRQMTAGDVQRFLKKHLTLDRSVLGIVGGADARSVKRALARHFAPTRRGRRTTPRWTAGKPGKVRVTGDSGQATVLRMMEIPADARELIAVGFALDLVGSDPDSRLFQEIRERLGLGYDVSASLDWGPDWAVASVSASASRAAVQRLTAAIDDVCRAAAEDGFADEEMRRARKKLRYRYASLAETRMERAIALAEGSISGFPYPEEAEKIVASLTMADVRRAWSLAVNGRSLTATMV